MSQRLSTSPPFLLSLSLLLVLAGVACGSEPEGPGGIYPDATATTGTGGSMAQVSTAVTGTVTSTTGVAVATGGLTTGNAAGTTGATTAAGMNASATTATPTTASASASGATSTTGAGGSLGGSGGTGGADSTVTTGAGGTTPTTTTTGAGGMPMVECTGEAPPQPPSEMQSTIDITWQEMAGELQGMQGARSSNYSMHTRTNMALDQLMAAGGTLSFCVRWGSASDPVSPELRDAIEETLARGVNEWFQHLTGYDCFPYAGVAVSVTGWAALDREQLQWEDGGVPIYVGPGDNDGLPRCPSECYTLEQRVGSQFSDCEGGYSNHFDQELRLQDGLGNTGFGTDFGQHVDLDGFVNSTSGGIYHIWLHEFGHTIGFPDYYDWSSWGSGEAPVSVMVAGRALQVTDWDAWMLRRTWSELKSRWDL